MACGIANRWRNTRCGGLPDTNDTTLAEMGTERDWMQFLWSWNTRPTSNASMVEIYKASRQVCHPDTCIAPGGGRIAGCTPSPFSAIDVNGARVTGDIPSQCGFVAAGIYSEVRYTWAPMAEPTPPTPLPPMPTPEQLAEFAKLEAEFEERSDDFLRARSYREGVVGYYDAEIALAEASGDIVLRQALTDRRNHFTQMARDHGVDENTTP